MDQTLKNLCLINISASFWAKHEVQHLSEPFWGGVFKSTAENFCKQVDALHVTKPLKADLKLVIIDFGEKKRFWTRSWINRGINQGKGKSLKYANVVHWDRFGMVDRDKVEADWEKMRNSSIPEFSRYPALRHDPQKTIYIEILPDTHPLQRGLPAMDDTGLVYFWERRGIDKSGFFISLLDKDQLANPAGPGQFALGSEVKDILTFDCPDRNPYAAYFVFEELNPELRELIFKVGQSELILSDYGFRSFFVNLFCHWPWQNEAFKYFTSKQVLSKADCLVLRDIMEYKKSQEMALLPPDCSFHKKVERFHNTVCRRC